MSQQQNQNTPAPQSPAGKQAGEPAQEWGERHEQGKAVARGGKKGGDVPGASEDATRQTQSDGEGG